MSYLQDETERVHHLCVDHAQPHRAALELRGPPQGHSISQTRHTQINMVIVVRVMMQAPPDIESPVVQTKQTVSALYIDECSTDVDISPWARQGAPQNQISAIYVHPPARYTVSEIITPNH